MGHRLGAGEEMTGKRGTPLERFERFYIPEPNSGCWLWIGSISTFGYGQLGMPGAVPVRAHVLSYKLFKGKVKRGLDVMHSCDVRCCVNPDHLSLGTRKQNMTDALKRGRVARGFKLPHTKLSQAQVDAVFADPRKYKEIAKAFGVSTSYISMIKNGFRRANRANA